jgi:hypothetical protein
MNLNKNAVIFFHKNIKKIYKKEWITKCVGSVLNQKDVQFDILEVNYGNESYSVLDEFKTKLLELKCSHKFYSLDLNNHVEAMVFLLNKAFNAYKYEIVFNTNLDDYYNEYRFKEQIECMGSTSTNYLMCSSMYEVIDSDDKVLKVYVPKDIKCKLTEDNKYIEQSSIQTRLKQNKNVINHSGVCFSIKFWKSLDSELNLLRYRNDKPYEDMSLWVRVINSGHQIGIINKNLISYRVHPNQITKNKSNEDINIHMDLDYNFKPDNEKRRVGIFLILLEFQIENLKKYLKSIEKYFVPEFKKYFFILTDNEKIISDKFVNTGLGFEFNVKQISNIKDNQNNLKFINYFYPKIELVCDIIFNIPLDNLLEKVINKYDISNEITKPFVLIKHGNLNIFGGITHYFLKFANSEIELHKFEIQNDKKIKVLSK